MNIQAQSENGICKLVIEGDLTIYYGLDIKAAFLESLSDCREVEVVLAGVTELDTAGCQLLLAAKRLGARLGKPVRFTSHSLAALESIDSFRMVAQLGDPLVIPAGRDSH